jgi:dTDP-glucose 4,6-dehydratase
MTVLVTGGAGFIASNFLHHICLKGYDDVVVLDKLTYAGDYENIRDLPITFYQTDIADEHNCEFIFKKHRPNSIFNFAAESHVDNSIKNCSEFIHTNINGTVNLLNLSVKYDVNKFLHVSTDEVYGSIEEGSFTENTIYNPRNPYSASKASSDHFVMAYHHTYGLPTVITNCSNNYGPRQNIEKMIPKTITNILQNKKIPVYGKGEQIRDWLYVQDHCEALMEIFYGGGVGEKYNIGGQCEMRNIDMVKLIIKIMNASEDLIEFVDDRPGHDYRYSTDITKVNNTVAWKPKSNLKESLFKTIEWYV